KSSFFAKKPQESIVHYQTLQKIEPLDAEDYKYLGRAHYELKKDTAAIRLLEQSLSMDSTQSDVYMDLGWAYMRIKKWDKAADVFRKKMTQDTSYVTAYLNYAICVNQLGQYENARDALLKVTAIRPKYLDGHYYLGSAYAQLRMAAEARKEYETVIALADTSKTKYRTQLSDAYRYIAIVHFSDKNWGEALQCLDKSLEFKPRDIDVMLLRASALIQMNRKEEARREYEKVLRIDPKNENAQKGIKIIDLF
ncbi:MAG TPA: tetratricopeptide repeat protein, partial [bacterium]